MGQAAPNHAGTYVLSRRRCGCRAWACVPLALALAVATVSGQQPAAPAGAPPPTTPAPERVVEPLTKIQVADCKLKGVNYIFNVNNLACTTCPPGTVPNAVGDDCVCPASSRSAGFSGPLSCVDCKDLQVSLDGTTCMQCSAPVVTTTAALVTTTTTPAPNASASAAPNASSGAAPNASSGAAPNASSGVASNATTNSSGGRRLLTVPAPSVRCQNGAIQGAAGTPKTAAEPATCTCPTGYAISDQNATGQLEGSKMCILCPWNSFVDPVSPSICKACPDALMTRDAVSGQCVCAAGLQEDSILIAGASTADIPVVGSHVCLDSTVTATVRDTPAQYGKMKFLKVIDVDDSITESVMVEKSEPFLRYFLEAATRCQSARRWQSCQALANLCTLTLHDKTHPACKTLSTYIGTVVTNEIHGHPGWRLGFPWITYEKASRDVLYETGINRQVALSGPDSLINLTMSVYALNGSFLGFESVTTQLQMCAGDGRTLQRWARFGANTKVECRIDLTHLIDRTDEPRFYELWMDDAVDKDGKTPRKDGVGLYPVPVLITNYEEDGKTPNSDMEGDKTPVQLGVGDKGSKVLDRCVLHRRFFLWDNVSGKKIPDTTKTPATASGEAPTQVLPVVVRWAKHVELRISLQEDDGDTQLDESIRMYPPHLIIEYAQQRVSTVPRTTIQQGGRGEKARYPEVQFKSIYTMPIDRFWRAMMALFITWIILTVVWAGIKLSVRSQTQAMTWNGCAADLLGAVADWFFWGMFLLASYWFIFFKLQSEVDSLLPIENPHPDFLVFVVVAGWCKIVHVCLLIYGQCNIYIFFIDFEKEDHSVSKEADALPNVSVWRNILIANEWCEMQTERHTDVDFTLMFLLFFLKGLKYINLATPQPEENDLSDDDPNIVLRFFVICFFYFLVVLGQVIYKALMYRFDSDPLDTFADLCNLSNISVFILDELDLLHGFYIHGRSVHPQTDVNMKTMLTNFNDEQENKTPPRGLSKEELVPEGHSNTVFEMYIPEKIRDELRDEYEKTAASSASKSNAGITKLAESHEAMNKMLQEKFVALADTNGLDISTPTLAHRMVGYPPVKKDMPVLLRDNDNSFASVLLFGIERDLVLMDLLVFVMWDLVFVDVFISALLTYLVSHALVWVRGQVGSNNVATKTHIPSVFLV